RLGRKVRKRHRQPDVPERLVHGLPLLTLLGELRPALRREAIVLPLAARLRLPPPALDVTLALETVEHRVEHAVGPLQLAAGKLAHALEDRVAVGVVLGQDGEDQRRGGGRDEVFVDVHGSPCAHRETRITAWYVALPYTVVLCMARTCRTGAWCAGGARTGDAGTARV